MVYVHDSQYKGRQLDSLYKLFGVENERLKDEIREILTKELGY